MPDSSTAIPYVDLAAQHAEMRTELLAAFDTVLQHGQFVLGTEVETFEKEFAELCGSKYAIGLNSGTDALLLALKSSGIECGDEVITVPNSFIATTSAIKLLGAKPVFVDVGDDFNIDASLIESAINERTKAIVPVHLTGRPAAMPTIMNIAQKYQLAVVEDAAQAVLAQYDDTGVGTFGIAGCFSLHPLKTLNACGDGGVIITDSQALYEDVCLHRNLGLKTREDCVLWASNSRLDTLHAAALLVKMKYVKSWTEARRRNAAQYTELLHDITAVRVPNTNAKEYAVYHTYVIEAANRDALKQYLSKEGIGTSVHYPTPIHLTTIGKELGYQKGDFPVAEKQAQHILSLPIHQLMTEEKIERVCNAIRKFYARKN